MGLIDLNSRKGCCYIRVSTDRQEELSPDAQKRLIMDYAKQNSIELLNDDVYMDIGISGKNAEKRPAFQEMVANAKAKEHPYDVILVWKFSRFARNQEESIVYKALLKKNDVEVISISEPLVDGPFGTLIERIIEWMDEYYSIRLSGEVKRGMQEKILRHGYVSTAPYGYDHVKGKVPTINEHQAVAVRKIFDMYVNESAPFRQIALWLNHHGYRTKHGTMFDTRRVTYILNNPFYVGKMRLNGEEYMGSHEHLIEDSLFDAAQEKYKKEYRPQKRKPADVCVHWLSGMLICPACGGSLGYNQGFNRKSGKSWPIFYCWKSGKGLCSERTSIPVHKAEKFVIDGLQQILLSNDVDYDIVRNESRSEEFVMIRKQLSAIQAKEERVKRAYMDGIDTLEEYRQNKQILANEKERLQRILEKADNHFTSDQTDRMMLGSVSDVLSIITDDKLTKEKKSAALRSICKKIDYRKATDEMVFHLYLSI